MGLIDYPGKVMANSLQFDDEIYCQSLKRAPANRWCRCGDDFQDPMTSLNPCFTVGYQIMEALKVHQGGSKSTRKQRQLTC